MSDDGNNSISVIAITAAVGAVVFLFVLLCNIGRKGKDSEKETKEEVTKTEKSGHGKQKENQKKSKVVEKGSSKKSANNNFTHPWLSTTLKGHTGSVSSFDFSPNGKYLISSAEDRSIFLWSTKEFQQKIHRSVRGNVELDEGCKIAFSPDSKAFVVKLKYENILRIYRLGKKDDNSSVTMTPALDFPQKRSEEIINISIASNGKYILTVYENTIVTLWDIKGEPIDTLDTLLFQNYYGTISPCGRFFGVSGFTSDVKVWEVIFDKGGSFKESKRAYELKGHNSGVNCFSFSNDSCRVATVSKDNTWKLFDTDVKFEMDQEPKLLFTGTLTQPMDLISLSLDGRAVAMAGGTTIMAANAITGKIEEVMKDVHTEKISALSFDVSGKYLASSGDRVIHILHNVTGYRATIKDLIEKEKDAKLAGVKERLKQQIKEARDALCVILGTENGHAGSK
ncbi:hypothetical protein LOTGIDRAFT_239070 [Lottia gigantea]|uniref:Uncharacterized protein n=1 Tax=Lottia gigantea TaxID=225164 RepID=V4AX77_LOTGI|nr:hypothetical protein LOTGIDRAFT_239070 [Lottia gigantea]ESO98166.1 hypothetical protein LOTGIDRAFT_239070 [Lottia gigantea]